METHATFGGLTVYQMYQTGGAWSSTRTTFTVGGGPHLCLINRFSNHQCCVLVQNTARLVSFLFETQLCRRLLRPRHWMSLDVGGLFCPFWNVTPHVLSARLTSCECDGRILPHTASQSQAVPLNAGNGPTGVSKTWRCHKWKKEVSNIQP